MFKFNKINIFAVIILFSFLICIPFAFSQEYELKVTDEHPFFVSDKWLVASELKVGDSLTTADGKKAKITEIEDVISKESVNVYNINVDNLNNYFANDVLVHNKPLGYITYIANSELSFKNSKNLFIIPPKVVETLGLQEGAKIWILAPYERGLRDVAIIKAPKTSAEYETLKGIYLEDYDFYARVELKLQFSKQYFLEISPEDMEYLGYFLPRGFYDFLLFEGSKVILRLNECPCKIRAGESLLDYLTNDFMSLSRSARIREFGKLTGKNLEKGTKERNLIDVVHNYPDPFKKPDLKDLLIKRLMLLDRIQVDSNGKPLFDSNGKTIPKPVENRNPLFTDEQAIFILRGGICGPENIPPMDSYFASLGDNAEQALIDVQLYQRALKTIPGFKPHTSDVQIPEFCTVRERLEIIQGIGSLSNRPWKFEESIFYSDKPLFYDPRPTTPNGQIHEPLNGWYYALIYEGEGGRTFSFLHPDLNVLLKIYPYKIKSKRDLIRIKGCVDSLVRVYFTDGEVVRDPSGYWPIESAGDGLSWKIEHFKDAFILRYDNIGSKTP